MPRFPRQTVAAKNNAANNNVGDVLGNKTDDEDGDSLYSRAYRQERHNHSSSMCYPTLAGGVVVPATNGVTNWTLGAITTIIPANAVISPFDIHFICVEGASADTVYELHLFYGDTDIFAGCVRFSRDSLGGLNVVSQIKCITPICSREFSYKGATCNSRRQR